MKVEYPKDSLRADSFRMPKSSLAFLIYSLLAWAVLAVVLSVRHDNFVNKTIKEETVKLESRKRQHVRDINQLGREYDKKKYLATGETAFDRIYNTQNQSIISLIERLAKEALPGNWSVEVRVEEFTNFILLISGSRKSRAANELLISCIPNILPYCDGLLTNVAVFDYAHKSYLLLDAPMLNEIMERGGELSEQSMSRAKSQGRAMTQFDSKTIQCQKMEDDDGEVIGSYLLVPVSLEDNNVSFAVVDTNAETTILTKDFVSESLSVRARSIAERIAPRFFDTEQGRVFGIMKTVALNVGGVTKEMEVAVSNQENIINIIGFDFFEGMNYFIDAPNSLIHVWEK